MNERAFRLDFFIAIAALIVSVLTTATLIYQTRVISNQYSATIWPYLTLETTYDLHSLAVDLDNDGLGPALIKSARLTLNGKPMTGWVALFSNLAKADPELRAALKRMLFEYQHHQKLDVMIAASSIGPGSTIRPGETRKLMSVTLPASLSPTHLEGPKIGIEFCYCSLDQRCWTLNSIFGQDDTSAPVQTSSCTSADRIVSEFVAVQ